VLHYTDPSKGTTGKDIAGSEDATTNSVRLTRDRVLNDTFLRRKICADCRPSESYRHATDTVAWNRLWKFVHSVGTSALRFYRSDFHRFRFLPVRSGFLRVNFDRLLQVAHKS
jgi:hypothetical protein